MGLALVVLVGAVAVAWLTGGTLRDFAAFPLRHRRLVLAAAAAQLVGGVLAAITGDAACYVGGLAASAVAALGFCLANRRLAGMPLVALGLLLNAAVVTANGAMPVSAAAATRANITVTGIAAGNDPRHMAAGAGTTWRALGDVVPVALPVRPEVASPGDLLVAAGLAELVVVAMRGRWRRTMLPPARRRRRQALAW